MILAVENGEHTEKKKTTAKKKIEKLKNYSDCPFLSVEHATIYFSDNLSANHNALVQSDN